LERRTLQKIENIKGGVIVGKIKKGVSCSVVGCNGRATHSISLDKMQGAIQAVGLKADIKTSRRVYLCEKHYKEIKKQLKKTKKIEKWQHGLPFT